jgi:hypothetical protein
MTSQKEASFCLLSMVAEQIREGFAMCEPNADQLSSIREAAIEPEIPTEPPPSPLSYLENAYEGIALT